MTADHEEAGLRWRFGEFELDSAGSLMRRNGELVELAPKSFDILVYLVSNRDRIVPRNELVARVWPDVVVSDAAVASALRDLRRALGDRGRDAIYVATIPRRGMRFIHDVRQIRSASEVGPGSAWAAAAADLEKALDALELIAAHRGSRPIESRERAELLVALARARWSAGAGLEAREAFLEALRVALAHDDAEIFGHAALGFAGRTDMTPGVQDEAVALLREALGKLSDQDSPLRAELLARLGTELYYEDGRACDELTKQAEAMAERTGITPVIAYVATARHFALLRPEVHPRTRLPISERALALARVADSSEVAALALQQRLLDLLELGDGAGFDASFEEFEAVATRLDQPFFLWLRSMYLGARALMDARIEDAERLAHETLEMGQRFGLANAEGVFAAQLFGLRRVQGRLGELVPALEAVAAQFPALPVYQAGLAAALAAGHASASAGAVIDEIMQNDLAEFPRDQNWIATLGTLAPAVATAGRLAHRRRMIELLAPYAGRMIVVGQGATTHGAVDHHLGLLHESLGEAEEAARCFTLADALHSGARARPWADAIQAASRARR